MDENETAAYQPLAERLACAWVSYKLNVTMNYAMNRYVKREKLGTYWLEFAKKLVADHHRELDKSLGRLVEDSKGKGDKRH